MKLLVRGNLRAVSRGSMKLGLDAPDSIPGAFDPTKRSSLASA
eukprot:CAMPEP_0115573824 /NCGR_PEP_ID=MMETSP0272-20121206/1205_1 /TAXON_ID=71861 /ORGANISM="Scrippsiella trochoidea, Strain CCMP3099" /LENGTH=42 /DNA_ID= /DNA_START= /DNA_END= /DNA_ORIENTATION=